MPKTATQIYRLFFASLISIALIIQIIASRDYLVEFFSYFTILSNILAMGLLFYLGLGLQKKTSRRFDLFRGATTLYMTITGIVYWTLLRHNPDLAVYPWINFVAHGIMPIVMLADWILSPPLSKLKPTETTKWLIFPLAFVGYSLVRGAFANWYPYFFVNPHKVGGYLGVARYVAVILLGAWGLSLLLVKIANHRRRK